MNSTLGIKALAGMLLAALVFGGAVAYRSHVWHQGFDTAVAERAARDAVAVVTRVDDNKLVGFKQDGFNVTVTKEKNETLAPVIRTIYVDRVRVGPGICGTTSTAKTEDAGSGDGGNPPGRLVSPEAEERIRELDVEVEKHLATGRACQTFGRLNDFYP